METGTVRFHTILTHVNPHADEHAAIWLLWKFGEAKFPGISTAVVKYIATGGKLPSGKTSAIYEQEGVLLVGVGGGRFDEHPSAGGGRKKEDCACSLVAKELGVEDDPALEAILKAITNNDLKGSASPLDIAHLAKMYHEQHPDDPKRVMRWVHEGLEVRYQYDLRMATEARAEFERNAVTHPVPGPFGKDIRVVCIASDDPQVAAYARKTAGADVVIVKKSSGHGTILVDQKSGIKMTDVWRMVRVAERAKNGITAPVERKALEGEGRIPGAEAWWCQPGTQAMLNGSASASDVAPTKLSIDEMFALVEIAMNPNAFEPQRAGKCLSGVCNSSKRNPCPWYGYGLFRCRSVRSRMYEARERAGSR